jgi:hypothetical protein
VASGRGALTDSGAALSDPDVQTYAMKYERASRRGYSFIDHDFVFVLSRPSRGLLHLSRPRAFPCVVHTVALPRRCAASRIDEARQVRHPRVRYRASSVPEVCSPI